MTTSVAGPVPIGTLPPLGEVPARMYAQTIRQDRMGRPIDAFKVEEVDHPALKTGRVRRGVRAGSPGLLPACWGRGTCS